MKKPKAKHILQHFSASEHEFVERILSVLDMVLERNRPQVLPFMSIREQEIIEIVCSKEIFIYSNGAFTDSERKRVIIAPFEQIHPQFAIVVGQIEYPDKYYKIDHRDVLGSLLATGIERKNIGDIRIRDTHIQIAMIDTFLSYLSHELSSIGRVKVQLNTIVEEHDYISIEPIFKEYEIIVSSLRLDTMVAKLAHVNRSIAKQMIERGYVQVNWQVQVDGHLMINDTDILSIRKFGRFYLETTRARTKKDNYVILVRAHE